MENPDNKQKHSHMNKANSRKPATYQRRLLRELNSNMILFERLLPSTIEKYGIKKRDGIYYSDLEL